MLPETRQKLDNLLADGGTYGISYEGGKKATLWNKDKTVLASNPISNGEPYAEFIKSLELACHAL